MRALLQEAANSIFSYGIEACHVMNEFSRSHKLMTRDVEIRTLGEGKILLEIIVVDEYGRHYHRREIIPGLEVDKENLIHSGRINMECLLASLSTKH